jgi:hypothetical protein
MERSKNKGKILEGKWMGKCGIRWKKVERKENM